MRANPDQDVILELSAVIVTAADHEPQVMLLPGRALPSGPFGTQHRTLEQGLRAWVEAQSGLRLGYVEQLYTFADKDRMPSLPARSAVPATARTAGRRMVSIGYLALVRVPSAMTEGPEQLQAEPWYVFFPWEDRRDGPPQAIMTAIMKGLERWKSSAPGAAARKQRESRIAINFPKDPRAWNEELVLQRYELLWEAGLIEEAHRGKTEDETLSPGLSMPHDHRRILATAMARLRAKIKYRPVVFELMPEHFTLLQLQNTVEALAGLRLHKQNFRRLVQGQGLVGETEGYTHDMRGRPAKLFAFRADVLRERAAAGTK
ncbi:MAG: hypothetical protein PHY92_08540, partial [Alphaproteobacteria bacterium]|nr:hypothetical protein [Alphaproteobacteria bacterium]